MSWISFDGGSEIGKPGTEGGEIIKDEEFDSAARITLEEFSDGHFAVTCGVYGTFFHTAWFDDFANYELMKSDIEAILLQENEDCFYRLIEEFTEKY